jgi:hypothetical protein
MFVRFIGGFAALSLFSGCAIHPLPEDVTGVSTYHVVRQIRCETRDTIRKTLIKWLSRLDDPLPQKLALQYENDPGSIRRFHYNLFKGPSLARVREAAKLFYDTGIAYGFDFEITENNNLLNPAGATFSNQFTNPTFTLGIGAGATWQRGNTRTFTATDTFSGLLTNVPENYCEGFIATANYVYPITGRIGVDKLVGDFIDLTLFGNLADQGGTPGSKGPPTMSDHLTYTTTISASANPMIAFAPVTQAFQLTNASLTASAMRTDVHTVTVALAISPTGTADLDPVRVGLFTAGRGTLVVGRRVTGGGSPSEKLAVTAIDQIKSRELKLIPAQ